MLIFSTPQSSGLTDEICRSIGTNPGVLKISHFSDGETFAEFGEVLRGKDVFIIASMNPPVDGSLMELLVSLDAAKRVAPSRVVAVVPYFGYARQDRKTKPRSPITARLVADMLSTAGADYILTADIHSRAIEGFFNTPFTSLSPISLFVEDIKARLAGKDFIVVSPDVGGVVRARELAKRLDAKLAIIDKRRDKPNSSEVMNIIGDVSGKHCVIIDDMIDTGGTLAKSAAALKTAGAASVRAYATHGVLSGDALQNLSSPALDEVVLTDTLNYKPAGNMRVISIAPLFAEAMKRIHGNQSMSGLQVF